MLYEEGSLSLRTTFVASDAPSPGFLRSTMAPPPTVVQVTLLGTTLDISRFWAPQIQPETTSWVFYALSTP